MIMRKIYRYATAEQIHLKVRVLQAAVQESIDVKNSTTFFQRVKLILFVPSNRRALSK